MGLQAVRRYLLGSTASEFGNSAMSLVAGIWVKTLTGSSQAAAVVSILIYLPSLFAPLAGVLVDRVDRRLVLVWTNIAGAAVVAALVLVHGRQWVGLIYAVMLVYGATAVVIDPAETALFSQLVHPQDRAAVNGLRLSLSEGCKLLAPLVGAGLFTVLGGGKVALLDSASFLVAAGITWSIRLPSHRTDTAAAPDTGFWAPVGAGVVHIRRTPALRRLALAGAAAMFISGLSVAAQYALVDSLHRRPAFLGVLTSALGAGSIAAGLLSGPIIRRVHEVGLVRAGLLAGVVGDALLVTDRLPLVVTAYVVLGFFLPWVVIGVITIGQRLTEDHTQGRVSAALTLLLFGPQPVAQVLGVGLLHGPSKVAFQQVRVGGAGVGVRRA